jgi:hypothetical protein
MERLVDQAGVLSCTGLAASIFTPATTRKKHSSQTAERIGTPWEFVGAQFSVRGEPCWVR